jgi:hypothetical protein
MIAANNVLNALAMTLAAILTAGLYAIWPTAPGILIVTAFVNFVVSAWIFSILPAFRKTVDAVQH